MARFKTHTEGGSWDGGGTEVPNCSVAQQNALNAALRSIQGVLANWNLPCIAHVRDRLQDRLNCSLLLNCESGSDCDGLNGWTDSRGSPNITICPATFSSTQQRIVAVLFHELVHSVGGTELDSEALENHFFARGGATFPTSDDFPKFDSEGGEFVIWDKPSGNVFEKCESGGSWDSAPTVTRGQQLGVNFPNPPPPSGGGSWV
jgi:hypothetical protein